MEAVEYDKTFALEERHWWFASKRVLLRRILGPPSAEPRARIIDLGCGTGGMHTLFGEHGTVFALDRATEAIDYARSRGGHLVRGDLQALPFPPASFDRVMILDVLYHRRVASVAAALAEACRVCRPGGHVVITDSAFRALRGPHDDAMHGRRRFRCREIVDALESAGFASISTGYFFATTAPVVALLRWVGRCRASARPPASDLAMPPLWLNRLLVRLMTLEAAAWPRLPFGSSVVATATKPPIPRPAS